MAVRAEPHLSDAAAQGDDHPRPARCADRQGAARRFTLPIDMFFRSLAQDVGDATRSRSCCRAAAATARAAWSTIKRAGGLVIVESRGERAVRRHAAVRARRPASSTTLPRTARPRARAVRPRSRARSRRRRRRDAARERSGDGRAAAPAARQLRDRLLALQDHHGRSPDPAPRRPDAARRPRRRTSSSCAPTPTSSTRCTRTS